MNGKKGQRIVWAQNGDDSCIVVVVDVDKSEGRDSLFDVVVVV